MKVLGTAVKKKPVLLCLAGNLCSPSVFDRIHVPDGMQKLYLDYLGQPGPWDMESMGWEVVRLLDSFAGAPVILAGYSAGGVLAISTACKAPDQVAGLVLSNTGPCSIGHGNPGFVRELRENYDSEPYMRSFLSSCFYHPVAKEMEDELWAYTRTVSMEAGCSVSQSLREVDYREALKLYHNPAAIIHGRLDTRRKMDSVEMIRSSLPQAETTFLQTGHTPMWEDPEGYQKALDRLIRRVLDRG